MKIIGPIQDHYSTNGKHLAFMTNSMVFMFKVYFAIQSVVIF